MTKYIRWLLVLLITLLPLRPGAVIFYVEAAAGSPVTQMFMSHIGEVGGGLVGGTSYYTPLTQPNNWVTDTWDAFNIMPASGSVVDIRASTDASDILDTPDSAVEFTVQLCVGGVTADSTCGAGWTDTDCTVSADGDGSTIAWTDGSCSTTFAAGDLMRVEILCPATCNPPDTSAEIPTITVELQFDGDDTSILASGNEADGSGGAGVFGVYGFNARSFNNDINNLNFGRNLCPVAGDVAITGIYVDRELDDSDQTICLCEWTGSGADDNCGGSNYQAEELFCVTMTSTEWSESDTTCNHSDCNLSAGEHIFIRRTAGIATSGMAVGIALTNANQRWLSGHGGLVGTAHRTMNGMQDTVPCSTGDENECESQTINEATVVAMYSQAHDGNTGTAALDASATWVVTVQDNSADGNHTLTHNDSGTSPVTLSSTGTTDVLAAGQTFSVSQTPSGTPGTVGYCNGLLWESL